MPFDRAILLAPISEAEPCGPALSEHSLYEDFRTLANSPVRPDWAKHADQALKLAQISRDLRAWVWLTRASICVEGIVGLAAGLQLIADGLEQYWNILPPQHANENDPSERFMMRLSALTQLGATHFSCSLDDLRRFGRNFTDLQTDLDDMITKSRPDQVTRTATQTALDATNRIASIFARGFGPDRDPLVNFESIAVKLAAIVSRFDGVETETPVVVTPVDSTHTFETASLKSRRDVVRALDLVLDYYKDNDLSSPVPLLIVRARRLVSSSFIDAIKDLAPGGLKDLQIIAGNTEERK